METAMKVLQINTVCGIGSTGKIAASILKLLKAKHHQGRIAYGTGEVRSVDPADTYRIVSRGQYYAHNLLSRLTDREGLFSAYQTGKLVEYIRQYDPDIIHLHNLHGHYLNYRILFRFLAQAGKPVLWTLHDCWPITGHCTHFAAAGCSQWQTGCRNCTQLRQYPQCYTFGDVSANYRRKKDAFTGVPNLTLVTPSYWLAEITRESFLRDYPVHVIPNGIDLTVFKPTESDFRKKYHCEEKRILLGVASDWGPGKGLDVFVELSKRLDSRYRIVLVGTNETIDRQLPENILSIHRTRNQKELAEIYTAADIFVNPTREDTFPTVNLEALACGTPVLTFRTGGSPECIDGTCGRVVDCDDIDALEQEIRNMAAAAFFTEEACVSRAAQFDAEKRFEAYIRLYEDLLGNRT
jgi:glycosyltransferase involved in cell wall biosynthesis